MLVPQDGGTPLPDVPVEPRIDAGHDAGRDAPDDAPDVGERADAGDPTRCDALTCSGIPGNTCMAGLCVPTDYAEIALGETHACILVRSPGAIHCLGANDRGELGDGTRIASSRFVRVAGITDAEHVFVGRHHSCAIVAGGAVRCWGANEAGQCGAPAGADVLSATAPLAVGAAETMALGADHTCFLTAGGAGCIGGNAHGQLADGTTTSRHTLSPGSLVTDVLALGAGEGTTCVLRGTDAAGGSVWCAGTNDRGQLDGAASGSSSTLREVALGVDVVDLGVGDAFACAVDVSGDVHCWGANDFAQLGMGVATPMSGLVSPDLGAVTLTGIAVGSRHVIVRDVSGAWAWGDNAAGQLAFGTSGDPVLLAPERMAFVFLGDVATGGTTVTATDSLGRYFLGGLADELRAP